VVLGESRRSVPITGERPLLFWSGLPAIGHANTLRARVPAASLSPVECSASTLRLTPREDRQQSNAELLRNAQRPSKPRQKYRRLPSSCESRAVARAGREQMKHGRGDIAFERGMSNRAMQLRAMQLQTMPATSMAAVSMRSAPMRWQPMFQKAVRRRGDRFPRNSFFT
jgi:hypothetical protein